MHDGMEVGSPVGVALGSSLGTQEGKLLGSLDEMVLGAPDGILDGSPLGSPEGLQLGLPEGNVVGIALGLLDGSLVVGKPLGAPEGIKVGSPLGFLEGAIDGIPLGRHDGLLLGSPEGHPVGASVGAAVDRQDGSLLGVLVGIPEGEAEGLQLGCPDGSLLGLQVGNALGHPLGCPDDCPVGCSEGSPEGLLVGSPVGLHVGVPVGSHVGALDGSPDGWLVGTPEGSAVGSLVGWPVGTPEGTAVGSPVGTLLGIAEGRQLGIADGIPDGSPLGTHDGSPEGSLVASPVGNDVGYSHVPNTFWTRCPSRSTTSMTEFWINQAKPRGDFTGSDVLLRINELTDPVPTTTLRILLLFRSVTYATSSFAVNTNEDGKLNAALVPIPSTRAGLPEPATVTTSIVESISFRILCSVVAINANVSSCDKTMNRGLFILAVVPTPSKEPRTPEPATVVTVNVDNTSWRMTSFALSAIKAKVRSLDSTIPRGDLKWALVPVPSLLPLVPFPAKVVTVAEEITICLTRCPPRPEHVLSANTPSEAIVTSKGLFNMTDVPIPSWPPATPAPTNVLTTPDAMCNCRILWLL
jgi:hypothetical protein